MPRNTQSFTHELAARKRTQELAEARATVDPLARRTAESRLVRTWIDAEALTREPSLQELAWVEYRYLTPLQRTEAFTRAYRSAYLAAYAKRFPEVDTSKKQPIEVNFVRNDIGVMNALWNARAHADAAGIPYDLYLETIMEGHLLGDKWKRPPRPNQLYGKLTFPRVRDLLTHEQTLRRLYGPTWDPRFFAEAYIGDPIQEAAIGLLRHAVLGSDEQARMLGEFLCHRRAITEPRAVEAFGESLVKEAISVAGGEPIISSKGSRAYVPACFGHPDHSEDSPCMTCPVRGHCVEFTRGVKDDLLRLTGSEDPRKAWKREAAKLRKRRQRQRDQTNPMNRSLASVLDEAAIGLVVDGGHDPVASLD